MTIETTLERIRRRLLVMDARHARMNMPSLLDGDMTFEQRHREVLLRMAHLLDGPPDVELLEVAASHLVALIVTADRAEEVQPHTGEAA